jgi:hypothetical protein
LRGRPVLLVVQFQIKFERLAQILLGLIYETNFSVSLPYGLQRLSTEFGLVGKLGVDARRRVIQDLYDFNVSALLLGRGGRQNGLQKVVELIGPGRLALRLVSLACGDTRLPDAYGQAREYGQQNQ